jgi:tRNA pseudouridine55 synthase
MRKHYRATFRFGCRSDTDDTEGYVQPLVNAPELDRGAIVRVLPRFLGSISQRPPAHSAVKVAGKRAYKLARRGAPVELSPRTVVIHRLDVVRFEYPELELDIQCGSGTYVRALGRDIAEALGTAAVMLALERAAVGMFHIADALPTEQLTADSLAAHLQPALAAVTELPRVTLNEAELVAIRHGRPVIAPQHCPDQLADGSNAEWAAVDSTGQLVAILREKHLGQLWPVINLGA